MTDQRPPYEDVEPAVARVDASKTRALPPTVLDMTAPVGRSERKLAVPAPVAPEPQPTWTEARIMRLASMLVFTVFLIGFVFTASRACPLWLAWLPFLVGALPYFALAWLFLGKHLDDEGRSRERRERWEHSRLDVLPLARMDADTERYQ